MKCLFYQLRVEKKSITDAAYHVVKDVLRFWNSKDCNIETKRIDHAVESLKKTHSKRDNFNRQKSRNASKIDVFKKEIENIFDVKSQTRINYQNQAEDQIESIQENEEEPMEHSGLEHFQKLIL